MASRRVLVGVILLIVGLLIFAAEAALPQTASQQIPAGAGWTLTPTTIGDASVTISWSGGTTATNVTLFDCGSSCPGSLTGLAKTATGSGASGSLGASLTPGNQYLFVETNGTATLSASYSVSGLTILAVIGLVIAVVGTLLVILPTKPEEPAPAMDAAPVDQGGYADDPSAGNPPSGQGYQ
jgi:hypothetical protein